MLSDIGSDSMDVRDECLTRMQLIGRQGLAGIKVAAGMCTREDVLARFKGIGWKHSYISGQHYPVKSCKKLCGAY